VDSGNLSECSPLRAEQENDLMADAEEHLDNFEHDLSQITQKINTLSKHSPIITRT
jgi:hypothetical protein